MPLRFSLPSRIAFASALAGVCAFSGCAAPSASDPRPGLASLVGTASREGDTPYSDSLRCLRRFASTRPVRIVVGPISDRGTREGALGMTIAAFGKAGIPTYDHLGVSVAKGSEPRASFVLARSVPGSDFYLAGSISDFDGESEAHAWRLRVGLDLRLVDINTRELAQVVSYQRELTGRQEGEDALQFMGQRFFATQTGTRAPAEFAKRSAIERAVLKMVLRIYGASAESCAPELGGPADPLAGPGDAPPEGSLALLGEPLSGKS